jgi:hypothetical protein
MAVAKAKPRKLTNSMRNTLQRERSNKRTISHATAQTASLEATRSEQLAAREATHSRQRIQTEQGLRRQRQVSQIQGAAVGKVVDTATPSGNSNLIMTTIFVMAGLIIMYQLVTKSAQTSGFLSGLGTWIHTIGTSNTPLFVTKTAVK